MQSHRQLVLRTPAADNKEYVKQLKILSADSIGIKERDLTILEDISPSHKTFSVRLIGKDGTEKLNSNAAITIEKLFGLIDAMPMRQREKSQRNINDE